MDSSVDSARVTRGVVLVVLVTAGLLLAAQYSYPLFHMLVEMFSTVIAFAAFVLVWDARHHLDRDYLLLLGIGLLSFAMLDLPHMLSFEGLRLFPGFTNDLPTQIFVAQRYLLAAAFLIAPFFVRRRLRPWVALLTFLSAVALVLAALFWWRIFPAALVPGRGLTPFKIVSEYVIVALFALSLAAFLRQGKYFRRRTSAYVALASLAFIVSEVFFTLYSTPHGAFNLLGHLAQVGAFALLYGAIVHDGLIDPYGLLYRELAESEERFRATFEQSGIGIARVGPDRRLLEVNPALAEMLGYDTDELVGMSTEDLTYPDDRAMDSRLADSLRDGSLDSYAVEKRYVCSDGTPMWVRLTTSAVRDRARRLRYYVGIVEDIAARKQAEAERERLMRRLDAIGRITDVALSSLVLDDLLDDLLQRLLEVTGADSVFFLVREGDELRLCASRGMGTQPQETVTVPVGEGIAGLVATTGEAAYVEDVPHDPRIRVEVFRASGIISMLAVPMRYSDEVMGVVNIGWMRHHDYDVDEVGLLRLAADRIALAYRNATLYEGERHVAETLQEGLISVPSEMAGVGIAHIYRSATEQSRVGGDFYDAFELDIDRIGLLIGDISGKGVAAATLTGLVRNSIHVHASEGLPPSEAVARTNVMFFRDTPSDTFVTLIFAVIDRAAGTLIYCNAGHPAGVVRQPDGEVRLLSANSPLVGAFENTVYADTEVPFETGDELFLYTDGLVEARRGRELFGEARVVAAVRDALATSLDDQLESVLTSVQAFAGGELNDDAAALVVRLERTRREA